MIIMALLAGVLAALLWVQPAPARSLGPRLDGGDGKGASRRRSALVLLAGLIALLPLAALAGRTHSWTLAAVTVIIGGTGWWISRGALRRRRARRLRGEIAHACRVLAGQLRVGAVPAEAIRIAAEDCPVLADAAAQQELGGDVVTEWRRAAVRPGGAGLGALARSWQLSAVTGAPMAPALQQLAEDLTAEEELAQLVAGELSSSRATGQVMACLPLVGLGLGYLVGGDPAGFLLGSGIGQVMLLVGVALAAGGLCWIDRIAALAEDPP